MGIGETLGKQVGPLPVGGWIAVIAGGLAIGGFARRYTSQADYGEAQEVSTAGGTMPGAGNLGAYPGTAPGTTPGQGELATDPVIDTNKRWRDVAMFELLGRGYVASLVDRAIGKYFTGSALSVEEQAVIDAANTYIGPTPDMVPPPYVEAPPVIPNPAPLPSLNSADWALVGNPDWGFIDVGTAGPGGFYEGYNVAGGAPVYAFIGGQWVQNWNADRLAPGTKIGIPQQLAAYIDSKKVVQDLTPEQQYRAQGANLAESPGVPA